MNDACTICDGYSVASYVSKTSIVEDVMTNNLATDVDNVIIVDGNSSSSSGNTSKIIDPYNVVGRVGAVIASVIIVTGIVGNLLVFVVIISCPRLHRSANAFIASLAVTDFIFNVFIMPFYVDAYFYRKWRFSDELCRFHTYFGAMAIMSSSCHIGLIAFNRYALIVRPRVKMITLCKLLYTY